MLKVIHVIALLKCEAIDFNQDNVIFNLKITY